MGDRSVGARDARRHGADDGRAAQVHAAGENERQERPFLALALPSCQRLMPVLVAMQEKIAKAVDWARACATAFVFSFVDLFRFQSATVSRVADCVMSHAVRPFSRRCCDSAFHRFSPPPTAFHRGTAVATAELGWLDRAQVVLEAPLTFVRRISVPLVIVDPRDINVSADTAVPVCSCCVPVCPCVLTAWPPCLSSANGAVGRSGTTASSASS